MKKTLNTLDVMSINSAATTLRACHLFPMPLANEINAFAAALEPTLKALNETQTIVEEKRHGISLIADEKIRKEAYELLTKEIMDENKKTFAVTFNPIKADRFADIEIKGDKEVQTQQGGVLKYNYRDAYFTLVNHGLIA